MTSNKSGRKVFNIRFLPTNIHGVIDYVYSIALVITPWAGGFSHVVVPTLCMVAAGAVTGLYSLITRYEWGVVKMIPMTTHLFWDFLFGIFLLMAPWSFGFRDRVCFPFILFGAFAVVASVVTETVPFGGNWRELQKEL